MRSLPVIAENMTTLASAIAVAVAAGMAFRARLPWLHISYLVAQCAFAFVGWWALCRPEMYKSRAYFLLFTVLFFPIQLFTIYIACDFKMPRFAGLGLMASMGLAVIFAALRLYGPIAARGGPVDLGRVRMCLGWGATLIFSGFLSALALAEPMSVEMRYVVRCFAAFWLLLGAWLWAYAASQNTTWDLWNQFVPPMLAMACFGWLAFQLNGLQGERAFESVTSEMALSELHHLEAR